jgi:AcrR family transcriptional regulator
VTFEQVATASGVSRALVHAYLGDRRGLVDAIQVRIISRLDTWVGHGLRRAEERGPEAALAALVDGVFAFVAAEQDGWGVLGTTGGLDHPALHGVRARWVRALAPDGRSDASVGARPGAGLGDVAAQAAVGALLAGVGTWVNRGVEPAEVIAVLRPLVAGTT